MSTPEEPARLVSESSGASAELRRALGAARGDLPSPDHVEAMLARFPFPDGGGGGGGDTGGGAPDVGSAADVAAGAAKSAALGKWLGIAFLAASAGTVFYAKTTVPPHPVEPTASAVAVAVATASASTAIAVIATTPEPSASESSVPTASAAATSAPHAQPATATASARDSATSAPVRSEVEILKEAAGSRGNPARMLELVNEHARQHPKGVLGQEREMLRIEALVGLGRRAEAKALADAFRKGNPSSAYAERLNQIVPP